MTTDASDLPANADELKPPQFLVIVGASAGGLAPIEAFVQSLEDLSDTAVVIIQHLSRDFKSLMRELLTRRTEVRVERVTQGMALEPATIYLIPAGKTMTLEGHHFHLVDQDLSTRLPQYPINLFLESAASAYRECCAAVILSGTGTDGTRGCRDVHDAGGLVLVQTPNSAQFDGMPRSAILTGVVDSVHTPEDLVAAIDQWSGRVKRGEAGQEVVRDGELSTILEILQRDERVDFSHYKTTTLRRRIERRLGVIHDIDVDSYIAMLQDSAEERNALRRDLLIGVTRFFRDIVTWRFLEKQILPGLVADLPAGETFRIWVAACSSGEEAYTIAMLAKEAIAASGREIPLKIFATDLNPDALEIAAAGIYQRSIEVDIDSDRLARYFRLQNGEYRVSQSLREVLIFAPHNMAKDSPFTRMSIVTCRNALIYMQVNLQQKVMRNLHTALKHKGVLMLGKAETVGELANEFDVLAHTARLYRKNSDVRLFNNMEEFTPSTLTPPRDRQRVATNVAELSVNAALSEVMQRANSTALMVSFERALLRVFGDSTRYLRIPEGHVTVDATRMIHPALSLAMNAALHRCLSSGEPSIYRGLLIKADATGPEAHVDLHVSRHKGRGRGFLLVIISPGRKSRLQGDLEDEHLFDASEAAREQIHELGQELQQARESLQATIEELETTNEEQQATNEELMASNEELQSTNEELQSVNEELYTVNAEFQSKIKELTELTEDVGNLLQSTGIGTIFLDRGLCIRKFTETSHPLVAFSDGDLGRPLAHFSINLRAFELMPILQKVLVESTSYETEVIHRDGTPLLLRVNSYQMSDGTLDGLVITLVDISELHRIRDELAETRLASEAIIRAQAAELSSLFERQNRLNALLDERLHVVRANEALLRLGTAPAQTANGTPFDQLFPDLAARMRPSLEQVLLHGEPIRSLVLASPFPAQPVPWVLDWSIQRIQRPDGGWGLMVTSGELEALGKDALDTLYNQSHYKILTHHSPIGMALYDDELRYLALNPAMTDLLGWSASAHIGRKLQDAAPEASTMMVPIIQSVLETGAPINTVLVLPSPEGPRPWRCHYQRIALSGGRQGVLAHIQDVTEDVALRTENDRLRHELEALRAEVT